MRHRDLVIIAPTILLALTLASCRAKQGEDTQEEQKRPVAEVRQTLPTPTLAQQQPISQETPSALSVESQPPQGPITVQPPPEAALSLPPTAAPPAPSPEAGVSGPPPTVATPAPQGETQPIAPPSETPQKAEGGVQALPATGISVQSPSTEEQKPAETQALAYKPTLVKAQTNIDLIIDASGSMAAPFAGSVISKLDMVRQAIYDIIAEMSQQQADFPRNIAIRVFGSKFQASENNRQDTELLVPMGSPDLGGIRSSLDKLTAQGLSPIALAITNTKQDFPEATADRVVVLVADGIDNTEGDACKATEEIEAGPQKTTFYVVAFDVATSDVETLKCVADKGEGELFVARNENELRTSLDKSINSTVPYNLKLVSQAGIMPVPFELTVFKAGTEKVVRKDKSLGTKLLKLGPGSYDILVEYRGPEKKRPSKVLKGVEILATTKAEQTINFDLGQLTLTALGNEGNPSAARYEIKKSGTQEVVADVEAGAEPSTYFIAPGSYDITADLAEAQFEEFTLTDQAVEIKVGEATSRTFRFQKGEIALKGITTQKEAIPFTFQVYKAGEPQQLVASGALPADGGSVSLAPGTYDILVTGAAPKMTLNPRTKVSAVVVKATETTDIAVNFEMGVMKLAAVDAAGAKLPAEFVIRDHATQLEMAKTTSETGEPVQVPIPPGEYDIVASSTKSLLEPKPSVPVTGVVVTADKPTEQTIKFILGTLRLRGRNAKEQPIKTQFTIYEAGSDEKVATAPTSTDWTAFDLAPGRYDALAVNIMSEEEPKPMIWLRDISIAEGKAVSHEAIYTAGKLKIIGRGPNNQIITCYFKVYQYGADTELINGVTGLDWEIFEIRPGNYYIEASYHDDAQSVMLKKWISLKVGENEVVEEVLRF